MTASGRIGNYIYENQMDRICLKNAMKESSEFHPGAGEMPYGKRQEPSKQLKKNRSFCMPVSNRPGWRNDWIPPLLILGGLSIPFVFTDLDLALAGLFYVRGPGWVYKDWHLWRFLYHYGNALSILFACSGLACYGISFYYPSLRRFRKPALFIMLLMILGPGLVVNLGFKENWVRPRPCQLAHFDGRMPFYRLGEMPAVHKGDTVKGKSFPSGHASAAFYLMFPFFLLRDTRPLWARTFLATGCAYGAVMGICRMIQGGHFASDVIWAGGFVYLCGMMLYYGLGFPSYAAGTRDRSLQAG